MTARVLMVVGASSSAGKSLLVTALCRIYARRGLRVAPFKAQNMSNNAAVCPNGDEIGRAQAVQALAAGMLPTADVNPILLKPEADSRSQVVVMGRPLVTESAREYYRCKAQLWPLVTAALDRLRAAYDLVIIEGAGSPVELNLKSCDIVNMPVASYAAAPVLLVGDIDRGGIFAQLLGTLWLLEPDERRLVRGLVVNKFRGDLSLFGDGARLLEARGGVPVLGVVPYLKGLDLPEEDAVALDAVAGDASPDGSLPPADLDIAVIHLPHIANFDDFDPLASAPGVRLRYVASLSELGSPCAVVLPGTKSTVADLDWLRQSGLAHRIQDLARSGAAVVGICGGYQMLGESIQDPDHVEAPLDACPGLGLLPLTTVFQGAKATHRASARVAGGPAWLAPLAGEQLLGYEIHMGQTASDLPWLRILERSGGRVDLLDGAVSPDGRVWGCYLHGLFENESFRLAWLASLGWHAETSSASWATHRQAASDRLAEASSAGWAARRQAASDRLAETSPAGWAAHRQAASDRLAEASSAGWAARQQASFDRLADAVASALDMHKLDEIIHSGVPAGPDDLQGAAGV